MDVFIRHENPADYDAIKQVNDLAFGQAGEGLLVEQLRMNSAFIPKLSLVAEVEGKVLGHILFYPLVIKGKAENFETLSLAPMSVLPEYQNLGIGSLLVKYGLERVQELKHDSVIVLGHEQYYPRFGFQKASKWQITCAYDVPDNAFMAIELAERALENKAGMVIFPKEFDSLI